MTEASRQPKDKNYNLISVLYHSSENVESLKSYIQGAQSEGDQELVEFFDGVLENNLRAAQQAKEMLIPASRASKSRAKGCRGPRFAGPRPFSRNYMGLFPGDRLGPPRDLGTPRDPHGIPTGG